MREQKFDFVIYPLDLIITVGLDYKTLCDRFENMEPEHEGKWGDEDDMDKEASFANLVRDRDDDDKFAILWNFSSDDDLIMRYMSRVIPYSNERMPILQHVSWI